MYTNFPWLLSPVREGVQRGAPSTIQMSAGALMYVMQTSCPGVLLAFPINQVIQPLFSTKLSYYTISS